MKIPVINIAMFFVISIACCYRSMAQQFSLSGQLRIRSELRDGQGSPLSKGVDPAFFISQRTRLNVLFNTYRLKTNLSIQDTRVWGQDVSTINRTTEEENNGIMLHEAWAEILLTDTILQQRALSIKLGRQELVYDDQRLLGNLDWLQQGRRHDAALLKYERNRWSIHLGAAYNQNKENAAGTVFNNATQGNYPASTNGGVMYKSMEFLYAGKKFNQGNVSFLLFSDQFNRFSVDSINNSSIKTYREGSWNRVTTGFYFTNHFNNLAVTASAYYQFGKNSAGQTINAEMITLGTQYSFGKFSAGPGIDYTSGSAENNSRRTFDPLYGTPHKFWGLMDYFYAGSPFGKGGLVDYYLKCKFKFSPNLLISADFHDFSSASKIIGLADNNSNQKKLGQEIDLVASFNLTKQINIEGGYAHFFSTSSLTSSNVKNVSNARAGANWAYIMINIKPEFIFK